MGPEYKASDRSSMYSSPNFPKLWSSSIQATKKCPSAVNALLRCRNLCFDFIFGSHHPPSTMSDSTKPLLVIGSTPVYGHIMPLRSISKLLIARGYEVTFVSASQFRPALEEVGCDYVPIEGYGDFYEGDFERLFPER